jgi:hypothetical protein
VSRGHTPGEWVLGPDGDTVETPDGTILADCSVNELPDAECRANATLIQSAPALLEACAGLLRVLTSRALHPPLEPDERQVVPGAIDLLLRLAEEVNP